MKLSDTVTLAAPRERVYAALTDPAMLKACIPGCTAVTSLFDKRIEVSMSLPTGLRTFKVDLILQIDDSGAPSRLILTRGPRTRADIELTQVGDATELTYVAQAELGGRAALLGARMLGGIAKRLIAGFFDRLEAELARAA